MLQEFVTTHRDEIILRCRAKGVGRSVPVAPPVVDHGVPLFLDQLATALHMRQSGTSEINRSALLNGHDLLTRGFTVSQVVHGYGDVCQSITELAHEMNAAFNTDDFRILNGCLDGAIAGAVTEYGRERERERERVSVASREGAAQENERRGFFAHELRDLIHTITIAFSVVKSGAVGSSGNTGQIIDRALIRAGDLISRSLAEVRLSEAARSLEEFPVDEFVDEVAAAARLEADARGLRLTVISQTHGARIRAERAVLVTAVTNLLQNALKFTRPGSEVVLGAAATDDRVVIEVADECGGLAPGDIDQLFHSFIQRHENKTGLGLGLVFTRQVVEAVGGLVSARNLPSKGCVFSADLPRVVAPAVVVAAASPPQ